MALGLPLGLRLQLSIITNASLKRSFECRFLNGACQHRANRSFLFQTANEFLPHCQGFNHSWNKPPASLSSGRNTICTHHLAAAFYTSRLPSMIICHLERATHSMASGCFDDAISVLDHTLVGIKSYFLVQAAEAQSTVPVEGAVDAPPASRVNTVLGPSCVNMNPVDDRLRPDSDFPMCPRIVLVKDAEELAWNYDVNLAVTTAAVLYNKGLIYHLRGQGETDRMPPSDAYLRRARVLYDAAWNLISTCTPDAGENVWLKAALLTNLGSIASYLCDRPTEQRLLVELEALLSHCVHETHEQINDEMDLKLNVLLLLGSQSPAPAA